MICVYCLWSSMWTPFITLYALFSIPILATPKWEHLESQSQLCLWFSYSNSPVITFSPNTSISKPYSIRLLPIGLCKKKLYCVWKCMSMTGHLKSVIAHVLSHVWQELEYQWVVEWQISLTMNFINITGKLSHILISCSIHVSSTKCYKIVACLE